MRPETKELYPDNWPEISKACIARANHICQDCGQTNYNTTLVLTTHHKDYDPSNNAEDNLVCLCQGCHLRRQSRDLANAIRFNRIQQLIRMGQLLLPGFAIPEPKIPSRVLEGKALATSPKSGHHAQLDSELR